MTDSSQTSGLKPWQERVIQEHRDLADKLKRLVVFLNDPNAPHVSIMEALRLRAQLKYMRGYKFILNERIKAFT